MGAQWTLAECLALLYLEVLVITVLMLIQWEVSNVSACVSDLGLG